MVSTCPGPRVEVAGPRIAPSRFGLFSVAAVEDIEDGTWEWGLQYRAQGCDNNVYTWPRPCLPAPLPVQNVDIVVDFFIGKPRWNDSAEFECSPPPEKQDYQWLFAVAKADPCWALPPGTRIQVSVDGAQLVTIPIVGPKGAADEEKAKAGHYVAAISNKCTSRLKVREAGLGKEVLVDLAPSQRELTVTIPLSADPEVWLKERRKVLDGPPGYVCGDPFWIYSSAACSPMADFVKDAEPMAVRRMESGEQIAVERWLWRHMRESHPIPVGGECSGSFRRMPWPPRARVEVCLSRLEAALTETLGGIGVLHVPAVLAMRLASLGSIWTDLQGWYTPLGTPVVFGTGYDATVGPVDLGVSAKQLVMYGTGPVTIRRGPIKTYEGFDRITNEFAAISERAYVVTTDCALLYVACPNDWCMEPPEDEDGVEDGSEEEVDQGV